VYSCYTVNSCYVVSVRNEEFRYTKVNIYTCINSVLMVLLCYNYVILLITLRSLIQYYSNSKKFPKFPIVLRASLPHSPFPLCGPALSGQRPAHGGAGQPGQASTLSLSLSLSLSLRYCLLVSYRSERVGVGRLFEVRVNYLFNTNH